MFSGVVERTIGFRNTLILGYALAVIGGLLVSVSDGNSEVAFAIYLMLS